MKKYARPIALILIAGASGMAAETYLRYRRDMRLARERVRAGSHIVDTACGPIECAVRGEGPAVLVVHGAGGGYDQGLLIGRGLVTNGFQVVAPSRFGYLRTPLPADASAQAQADAHACLLDALSIPRAAIIGVSAGAPSSLQFALRHRDRCSALVLVSAAIYGPSRPAAHGSPASGFMVNVVLRSDFPTWLASKVARRRMIELLGVPRAAYHALSLPAKRELHEMMRSLLPMSLRRDGLLNDGAVVSSLERYALEEIATPTLVIAAADDPYGVFAACKYTADNIPGARFIGFERGGHLLLGHQDEVQAEIAEFIRRHG
jgi:pimeloyl-ACP methyl ester carboxylesterase